MDGMFPEFDVMFWAIFIFSIIFMVVFLIVFVYRAVKGGKLLDQAMSENQSTVKEKEIIREIVKIRCPYCGGLYDENMDKCPNCGAKKP
jgi:DNA-directed RNA polymerase subunit RPC12/RpoP